MSSIGNSNPNQWKVFCPQLKRVLYHVIGIQSMAVKFLHLLRVSRGEQEHIRTAVTEEVATLRPDEAAHREIIMRIHIMHAMDLTVLKVIELAVGITRAPIQTIILEHRSIVRRVPVHKDNGKAIMDT